MSDKVNKPSGLDYVRFGMILGMRKVLLDRTLGAAGIPYRDPEEVADSLAKSWAPSLNNVKHFLNQGGELDGEQ